MPEAQTQGRGQSAVDSAMTPFGGAMPLNEALAKLRLRLLDLTSRNRLLNFKPSPGRTLGFVGASIQHVFDKLVEAGGKIVLQPVPAPRRIDWVEVGGRMTKPDVREYARNIGWDVSAELPTSGTTDSTALRVLQYPDDLERHARKLAREARSAIEETGANMLFLVVGLLEYPEKEGAERLFTAPLLSIPVSLEKGELERGTGHYRYSVAYTGEDIADNLSLREKLKADFTVELPAFSEGTSVEAYLEEVAKLARQRPQWRVKRQMMLALLSFSRMLLVRDLDPNNWPKSKDGASSLTGHDVVRMIFEGSEDEASLLTSPDEYEIDGRSYGDIPLIYDCDSSQHSALIDALTGRHLVIEGPPGTGKSQTITNLIAAAISQGKKVLFISEKLAALQVVKERLERVGLGDFCLELHSNKTNKKRVIDDIARRKAKSYREPPGLEEQLKALEEKKTALKSYVELVNTRLGNAQGLTVHQVMWHAERFRQLVGDSWRSAQPIAFERAHELTLAEFRSLSSTLSQAANLYDKIGEFGPSHPFWGFYPDTLDPEGELEIERLFARYVPILQGVAENQNAARDFLADEEVVLSAEGVDEAHGKLQSLLPQDPTIVAFDCLEKLFAKESPNGHVAAQALKVFSSNLETACALEQQKTHGLRDGVELSERDADEIEALANKLRDLGLDGATTDALGELVERFRFAADEARKASERLERATGEAGVALYRDTWKTLLQIVAVTETAAVAPTEFLHLRHEGLRRPDSGLVAERAKKELVQIHVERRRLSESLYLDVVPDRTSLGEAISVLREGQAWWRIFQGRYRRASNIHKRLRKSPDKASHADRLADLEILLAHQDATARWSTDPHYQAVYGPMYAGIDTRIEEANRLIGWTVTTRSRLVEHGIDEGHLDPVTVTNTRLVQIAKCGESVSQVVKAIQEMDALLDARANSATKVASRVANAEKVSERINLLETLARDIQQVVTSLLRWAKKGVSAGEIIASARAAIALPKAIQALENDTASRAYLGPRYAQQRTDLEPLRAAFAYGREVIKRNFPPPMTRALLMPDAVTCHARLIELTESLRLGWTNIKEFEEAVTKHGRFEIEQWAGVPQAGIKFSDRLAQRTATVIGKADNLLSWVQYLQSSQLSKERGLGAFVERLENKAIPSQALSAAFGYRFYASIAERLFKGHRELGRFSGATHDSIRREFAELDRDIQSMRGKSCASQAAQAARLVPGSGGARVDDKTEMQLLTYLFPQTKPRIPIRKLLRQAHRSIQAFKPCFLMGPQAVAQFLEPGAAKFDLVVMDEASQLKPEEAIGSVARGQQLIVVGDPNQLPPTTFFDKLGETADDESQQAAALELESILDVCMGHFHPVRRLVWHYRSRHQSLIAFSNKQFYDGNLIVFPSPYENSRRLGVRYEYVPGAVYDNQRNEKEARRVVEAVVAHMLEHPEESLGVVTLNLRQRDLIEDLVDERLKAIPKAEEFRGKWHEQGADFFVKNLENVQGDERDVIFISTTFGKGAGTTVVRQNFGPISRGVGWKRLNVLFTRAKRSVHVYSSMQPEDIVDDQTTPAGTKALRAYLEYARSGKLEIEQQTGAEPDSEFERAVASMLSNHGYACVPQLGVAGFRIDLAVRHPKFPNAYLAAIECDGATYHSGKSVRDRDRIRQQILEDLGWRGRIWRIWSTEWFRNPARESQRLITWLKSQESVPFEEAYLVEDAGSGHVEELPEATVGDIPQPVSIGTDDELEVSVGDTVVYAPIGNGQEDLTVHIASTRTDARAGVIWEGTPLAQMLIGAVAGEEVVLRIPGHPAQKFVVRKIIRVKGPTLDA